MHKAEKLLYSEQDHVNKKFFFNLNKITVFLLKRKIWLLQHQYWLALCSVQLLAVNTIYKTRFKKKKKIYKYTKMYPICVDKLCPFLYR